MLRLWFKTRELTTEGEEWRRRSGFSVRGLGRGSAVNPRNESDTNDYALDRTPVKWHVG
jgi:hypothetical protein